MKDLNEIPPFPLNTWIQEEIDVPSFDPVVNEKEKRVEFNQTTKKATQKTYYAHSTPRRVVCSNHVYTCLDKPKYLFKCTKCDWHKILYPVTYKFDPETGIVTHRETGERA